MNIINEIGDTVRGQEMLGRTAERAYQRANRTSGADKNRYMKTYNDAYRTGGKSANKHLGGSREHFDNGRDYEYEKWADEHNGNVAESKTMNKKLIRLTEQDLHRIVKESVNRILMESKGLDPSKRDSEFASNIKWSGEPDLDKANEWRKSWHNTHRGEKKVKGDTKFRDMARRENERGNFVHKLKTNPNEWFEKSVKESRFSAYKYANNPLLSKDEAEYWDNLEYPSDKEYNNMLRLIKQYDKNALYKMLGHDKYNAFMCRLEEDNPEIYKEYTHLNPDELPF